MHPSGAPSGSSPHSALSLLQPCWESSRNSAGFDKAVCARQAVSNAMQCNPGLYLIRCLSVSHATHSFGWNGGEASSKDICIFHFLTRERMV
mmetsp:Transcript_5421/g.8903  ORF Transcript_5421/g.8903 Transcript_5421/m.8903 type:complete len:92 (+) Transcript_5421:1412-1687(+)